MQKIYNTLTRSKQELRPVHPGKIRMYVCGITVYDFCHLGHARIFINFDIVRRWLKSSGFFVKYARNITDVDDKIIQRSLEVACQPYKVTDFYISAMHADESALGVQSPEYEPRATLYVDQMLEIIDRLKQIGLAYQSHNGDINFSVKKFPHYGRLSGKKMVGFHPSNTRIKFNHLSGKQDPLDFALWKVIKGNDPTIGLAWNSRYGVGRPGWHIECSAMSEALLGLPLDIHGGGLDLKFPHHENEIAQSESAFDCNLSNFWMHCGPVMMNGQKMSKSLGNFYTIRQIIGIGDISGIDYEINYREAEALRFLILRKHYRSILHFSMENLIDAQNSLDKLYQTLRNIKPKDCLVDWEHPKCHAFESAMKDDFNTSEAVLVLFELASQANRDRCPITSGRLKLLSNLLGLLQQNPWNYFRTPSRYTRINLKKNNDLKSNRDISKKDIETLVLARKNAKQLKKFHEADQIRDLLRKSGIELEDGYNGETRWRFTS